MQWEWKNFSPDEISCKGTSCECNHELWSRNKFVSMPEYFRVAMTALQALREAWGKPIIINSAHRCKRHNKHVGGSTNSRHMSIAFDCRIPKEEQEEFANLAMEFGFNGIGYYPNQNFVHIDMRENKTVWKM